MALLSQMCRACTLLWSVSTAKDALCFYKEFNPFIPVPGACGVLFSKEERKICLRIRLQEGGNQSQGLTAGGGMFYRHQDCAVYITSCDSWSCGITWSVLQL